MFDEDYEQENRAYSSSPDYVTKDSGKKTVHSDGVQRDTREGKTLYTLMFPKGVPLEEQLIHRVAELYTRGAAKYGDRNWENSCAPDTLDHHLEALWRHFMSFFFEENQEEDHAAALVWNINAVLVTRRNLALRRESMLEPVDYSDDEDEEVAAEQAKDWRTHGPELDTPLDHWRRAAGHSAHDYPAPDFPKFGTPEFDAKAGEVAAEQAKDWPQYEVETADEPVVVNPDRLEPMRENGRYRFRYKGHEFSDTGQYSSFFTPAESRARAIALFHNFLCRGGWNPVDTDPNFAVNQRLLKEAVGIPPFPYSGTVPKDRF